MATTSPDGLPYPTNYDDVADVPAALEDLAQATQAAFDTHVDKAISITAGPGLTGGGTLEQSRALAIDYPTTDARYAGAGHTHGTPAYATSAGNADTVDGKHASDLSAVGHGHAPSSVGIAAGSVNLGTIGPGAQASAVIGKAADQRVLVSVNHASTYIVATGEEINAGQARLEARNTTSGTTHTNVTINYVLVRQA